MAKIKNEYNYSTSVKSNLLFKEKSKLQEKKKENLWVFFFRIQTYFSWQAGELGIVLIKLYDSPSVSKLFETLSNQKEIFPKIRTHNTFVHLFM